MKDTVRKGIIVIIGILINVVGRRLAGYFQLPVWFDMTGTFLATYYAGIGGGIIAGIANNLISSFYDSTAWLYSVTSVAGATLMWILMKKRLLNNPLNVLISTFWMGVVCTVVSTPLNLLFMDGYSGNVWGDTLVDMLRWNDVSKGVSSLAGEAVVDIVDKQVCAMVTYLIIFFAGRWKKTGGKRKNLLMFFLASVLILGAVSHPLSAGAAHSGLLEDNFVGKRYDNTNGMVSSEANVISETKDGYIWIGSYAGLTKYDGSQFDFIREGGLVNVVGMMTDSRGRLWIGTNDAGIARYENGKYTYFTQEDGLPSNSIRCFAEDDQGNVYVGTSDRICRFDEKDTPEILNYDITFVKDMVIHQDMLIVLNNQGKIYALDGDRKLELSKGKYSDLFYYCLASTSKGLIAGAETGELLVMEVGARNIFVQKQLSVPAKQISALFEDSENRIWIATESGFGYLDEKNRFLQINLFQGFDTSIVCFHEDYQGNIWAASSHYGVMKLSESSFLNLFEKAALDKEYVNAVICYDGDYYCGTDEGLIILEKSSLKRKTNELTGKIGRNRVRWLFEDSVGRLWVCTYGGLFCLEEDGEISLYSTENCEVTSDRFRCIMEQKDGTIVAGTADGINYIKDGKVTGTVTASNGLLNTQILTIVPGKDGSVWAGSDGSGIYILSGEELVKRYTIEDGLSSNVILRLIPHGDGCLAVTSNALCHIDKDGSIRRLSNFPYFNNFDILIRGEKAYITCSAGLYEMKLSDLCGDKEGEFRFYGAGEGLTYGLIANSRNAVADDDTLLLCSNSGVVVFGEGGVREDGEMKCGLHSIECDGIKIPMGDKDSFVLPGDARSLSIYANVRNYGFQDAKVRFFIRELEDNPKISSWNEIEPIKIYKPELYQYTVCLQILDELGDQVLQEETYRLYKEVERWEKPEFKTYLTIVIVEILLVAVISLVRTVFFVIRKNELERRQIKLEEQVLEQTGKLGHQQMTIRNLYLQTVTVLCEAVDAKDRYTSGHSKRVAEYACMIAKRMGKSEEEQEKIYQAGLLHDIGKIRIPEGIINKPGKLTDEEYNTIKIHTATGYHILKGISDNTYFAIGAKYHHERYDGKGYPNGLEGDKIPEVARILGVADAYDAMASKRSYRDTLPQAVVRSEIEKGRGTQFDPDIADIMIQMIDEDKDYTMRQTDSMQRRILTVDDEPINNKIIVHVMRDEPMYEIVSAGGGEEALAFLEEQRFDLILLDVNMPDIDGMEVLRRIREKYDTPVVLMTSDKTIDSVEFNEQGFNDYITKPFLPLLLKEVIHYMTEGTKMG